MSFSKEKEESLQSIQVTKTAYWSPVSANMVNIYIGVYIKWKRSKSFEIDHTPQRDNFLKTFQASSFFLCFYNGLNIS